MNFSLLIPQSTQQQKSSLIIQTSSSSVSSSSSTFQQLQQFQVDPYLRRYFIIKYFLQSSLLSLSVWSSKLIYQNLKAKKVKLLSPWLELSIGLFYFNDKVYGKFTQKLENQNRLKKQLKEAYHKNHFFNSQYWH